VTVGSILEYRYQKRYDDTHFSSPFWEIQRDYYIHKAHYAFTPFENFMPHAQAMSSSTVVTNAKGEAVNTLVWWYNLPKGVSVTQGMKDYSVDITDVPPAPDEEYMPPIQSLLYKVWFYYSAKNAQEYWANAAKSWSKDVDKFAETSGTIKSAVAEIVSPGDSEQVKAEKLYKAVQALDNTDYTRAKSASEMRALKMKPAKHAEDTWKQKSGSSDDIAMLYLAMARAAGLTAFAMRVVDRNHAIFDPSLMDTDQFDDTLVVVGIGGKGALLDPGEKMCTFGQVSWKHSEAGGMRQSGQGAGFERTPGQHYTDNALIRGGDVTLDSNGGMTGYFTFTMRGQEAMRWRQTAIEENPDDLKKDFDKWIQPTMPQGVEAHVDHFLGLGDPSVNLMAIVKAKGALGTALPKRLLLPGVFFESRGAEPFVKEAKRLEAVDMRYAEETTDNVTYHLPAGYEVEGAPKDVQNLWQGHAEYVLKTQTGTGQITVDRLLARAFDLAKADEYQDLRGFYQKAAAADESELVLTQESAGKGN
ncbi:MAG: transglutaminase domain-containing protein, partial [Terracidiphilus sp.]